MPITVFDAVGKFSADTRNLDDFITKLDRALPDASQRSAVATKALKDAQDQLKTSLQALRAEGGNTADNWQKVADAQRQVAITSAAAKQSQNELRTSIGDVKNSTREARGEVMLMGDLFGIHLPRHVQTFIAQIPGLQKVLSSAFAVTAIYFFIQALGEGILKIEDMVRAIGGWTEAAQKAYAEQVKLNQTFVDLEHTREEAEIRAKERGLEGAALTKQQISDNKEVLSLIGQRLTSLVRTQQETQKQVDIEGSWGKAVDAWSKGSAYMDERREKITALTATLKTTQDEITALIKERETLVEQQGDKASQLTHQQLAEYIALESAKTENKRKNAQAQTDLDLAAYRAQYQDRVITFAQLVDLEAQTEQKKFQIDQQAMQDKLNLLKLDPTKNIVAITTLHGQIEAAEKSHEAKLLSDYATFQEEWKKLGAVKEQIATVDFDPSSGSIKKVRDLLTAIKDLKDMLHDLGEKSSVELQQHAAEMGDAFEKIKKSGIATKRDLILAEAAYVAALIESEKAAGQSTTESEKRLAAIEKEASKLNITLDKLNKGGVKDINTLMKAIITGSISAGAAMKVFGQITTEAIGASVAAAIEGSQSFGQAMEQWLKSTLSSLAGQAIVQAIVELAKGFAALSPTSPDFGHAGEHFTSAAIWGTVGAAAAAVGSAIPNGASSSSGQASLPQTEQASGITQGPTQAPAQTVNVPRFAAGGLVSGPTLAIIGDAVNSSRAPISGPGQREAAIPIDDDRATSAIAAAITKHMPKQNLVVHVHGKSLRHLIKDINHEVKTNDVELHASNSYRVTKKA